MARDLEAARTAVEACRGGLAGLGYDPAAAQVHRRGASTGGHVSSSTYDTASCTSAVGMRDARAPSSQTNLWPDSELHRLANMQGLEQEAEAAQGEVARWRDRCDELGSQLSGAPLSGRGGGWLGWAGTGKECTLDARCAVLCCAGR